MNPIKPTIEKMDLKTAIANGAKAPTKTFAGEDKKRGGRPKLPPEEKSSKNKLTVYLSDAEKAQIEEAAKKVGLNPQGYMKMATFMYLNANK